MGPNSTSARRCAQSGQERPIAAAAAPKSNWTRRRRRRKRRRRRQTQSDQSPSELRSRAQVRHKCNNATATETKVGANKLSSTRTSLLMALALIMVATTTTAVAGAYAKAAKTYSGPSSSSSSSNNNNSNNSIEAVGLRNSISKPICADKGAPLSHDIGHSAELRQRDNRYQSIVECQQSSGAFGGFLTSIGDCDSGVRSAPDCSGGGGDGGGAQVNRTHGANGSATELPHQQQQLQLQHQQQQQQQIDQLLGRMSSTSEHYFAELAPLWVVKDWYEILLRVCFVVPIVLLGVFGNLTIIYSMFKFKPFRSKPTNIFILNTALADLLTTIVCPNAALLTDIYQFYVLGAFVCRFEGFIKITCLLVSAYSLIVLSTDWLLSVVEPCRSRITIRKSWFAFCAIWVVSVLMASPLIMWRHLRERQWRDVLEVWCCEMIQYTKYYWVSITFFLIYLPTFFMTIVLIIILLRMDKFEAKLKRSRASRDKQQPSLSRAYLSNNLTIATTIDIQRPRALSCTNDSGYSSTSHTGRQNYNSLQSISMKYKRRIVKILFAYLLTSIICWSPLQFVIIYRHFRSETMPSPWFFELAFFASLAASLSSAMNPIIFGFLSEPFRRIVTKSWLFRLVFKLFSSSSTPKSDQAPNDNKHNTHRQLRPQRSPKSNPVANPIRNHEQDRYSNRLYPHLNPFHGSSLRPSNSQVNRASRLNPSMIRLNFDDIPMSRIARISGRPMSFNSIDSLRPANPTKPVDLINNDNNININNDLKRVSFVEHRETSNHLDNGARENASFEPDDLKTTEVQRNIGLPQNNRNSDKALSNCVNNKTDTTSFISERVRRVA